MLICRFIIDQGSTIPSRLPDYTQKSSVLQHSHRESQRCFCFISVFIYFKDYIYNSVERR